MKQALLSPTKGSGGRASRSVVVPTATKHRFEVNCVTHDFHTWRQEVAS